MVTCFTKGVYEFLHDGGHRVEGSVELRLDLHHLLR